MQSSKGELLKFSGLKSGFFGSSEGEIRCSFLEVRVIKIIVGWCLFEAVLMETSVFWAPYKPYTLNPKLSPKP